MNSIDRRSSNTMLQKIYLGFSNFQKHLDDSNFKGVKGKRKPKNNEKE
jgi:hypothetical protein